jgi:hypothetical protein
MSHRAMRLDRLRQIISNYDIRNMHNGSQRKRVGYYRLNSSGSVAGSCKHGIEPPGSIKGWKFLN